MPALKPQAQSIRWLLRRGRKVLWLCQERDLGLYYEVTSDDFSAVLFTPSAKKPVGVSVFLWLCTFQHINRTRRPITFAQVSSGLAQGVNS